MGPNQPLLPKIIDGSVSRGVAVVYLTIDFSQVKQLNCVRVSTRYPAPFFVNSKDTSSNKLLFERQGV